jgi:hypothetical protein
VARIGFYAGHQRVQCRRRTFEKLHEMAASEHQQPGHIGQPVVALCVLHQRTKIAGLHQAPADIENLVHAHGYESKYEKSNPRSRGYIRLRTLSANRVSLLAARLLIKPGLAVQEATI